MYICVPRPRTRGGFKSAGWPQPRPRQRRGERRTSGRAAERPLSRPRPGPGPSSCSPRAAGAPAARRLERALALRARAESRQTGPSTRSRQGRAREFGQSSVTLSPHSTTISSRNPALGDVQRPRTCPASSSPRLLPCPTHPWSHASTL